MATNQPDRIFSFEMGNVVREIAFVESEHITDGVDSDVYSFLDNNTQILSIVKVKKGCKSPLEKIESEKKTIEGFIKGKGTLTVHLESGTQNTYYFETAGYNKPVDIKLGQSVQWTAPHDADLVYYKIREIPQPVKIAAPAPVPIPVKPKGKPVKLFLTSSEFTDMQTEAFIKLVNKQRRNINIALIENAADVEKGSKDWILKNRENLNSYGFNVELVDLNSYPNNHVELLQKLKTKNVIWLGGGNSFYLHWLLLSTRANEIITYLVGKGVVYVGNSAGSVVAGPTLKHFETAEDPNVVPEIGTDGLHFTESVVIPHFDNPSLEKSVRTLNKKLLDDGYKTVPLNDNQALVIDGDKEEVI